MANGPHLFRVKLLVLVSVGALAAGQTGASVDLSILPAHLAQQPGDTILVELTVVNESDAFNAYDARVTYDPQRLLFLRMTSVSAQEGPLMTAACPQRFHIFTIAPDSTYLQINHSLLCAGVSVNGPGVVYRLRFRCRNLEGPTELVFGAPTAFYNNGCYVTPVNLADAVIQIGGDTAAPQTTSAAAQFVAAPNPFNPMTTLSLGLVHDGRVLLQVYDLAGRLVSTLIDDSRHAGTHAVIWNGTDTTGRVVASGTYVARLVTSSGAQSRRMTLLK